MAAFYWYERDAELLNGEKMAMNKFFPNFQLQKLNNGKLSWFGSLTPGKRTWYLQAVYQHNHPCNSTYGGSVRIYMIDPDLDILQNRKGSIPHVLCDEVGHLYICTARMEDIKAGNIVTTAASSIAWAVKWISAFELWEEGFLSSKDFYGHGI